ncbi:hypothetical protein BDA96_10G300300 [Sorghum bicolor]|uniref:Uncharacterized protein n=1 Tax=Sorghum bicolor TaxID=4558 RepID=A0A921Q4Z8_SORBI|nr:hypothetical protein BDA96_10G300300 [Sorghum bicolor]
MAMESYWGRGNKRVAHEGGLQGHHQPQPPAQPGG